MTEVLCGIEIFSFSSALLLAPGMMAGHSMLSLPYVPCLLAMVSLLR